MSDVKQKKSWKTVTGSIGAMLVGVGMAAKTISTGEFNPQELIDAALVFFGGLTLLGVGDKIQRLISAMKDK